MTLPVFHRPATPQIMTGPIYICGAEPGDTVKIEILDLYPRQNPKTGAQPASALLHAPFEPAKSLPPPGSALLADAAPPCPAPVRRPGKTYGSQAATRWGYHFRTGFKNPPPREVVTIYE